MNPRSTPLTDCTRRQWLTSIASAAALTACGGGGGASEGVGTGGTGGTVGTFSSGRVSGYGSIIVNDVHFDESNATVTDDDGNPRLRAEIALGMIVEVQAGDVATDASGVASAVATAVRIASELQGPVQSIDLAGSRFVVLGQTVKVDAATVFAGTTGGLASLAGQVVEVHGLFDAQAAAFVATRIARRTSLADYKLRGIVQGLSVLRSTFQLNGQTISFASLGTPAIDNGMAVRVKVATQQVGGAWVATAIRTALPSIAERSDSRLDGVVTDVVGLGNFKLNGTPVDASGAGVVFENGLPGAVAAGARLEVEGVMRGGVLVARKVAVKSAAGGGGSAGGDTDVTIIGPIESAGVGSFVVRGVTVTYDANTRLDNGTVLNLVKDARVEVRGTIAASGTAIAASRIRF